MKKPNERRSAAMRCVSKPTTETKPKNPLATPPSPSPLAKNVHLSRLRFEGFAASLFGGILPQIRLNVDAAGNFYFKISLLSSSDVNLFFKVEVIGVLFRSSLPLTSNFNYSNF